MTEWMTNIPATSFGYPQSNMRTCAECMNTSVNCNCGTKCAVNFTCALVKNLYLSCLDCRQAASSLIQQQSSQGKHLGRKEKPGHKRVLLGASSLPRCDAAVLGKQFLCLERMCSLCSQGFMVSPLLHPWVLEIGSGVDRANCLVDGSVRTLENNFKTAGRSLNDVLKYTVDDFTRSSDDSWAKNSPRRGTITLHYIWLRKASCENCTSIFGRGCVKLLVEISNYWLKITFGLIRHIEVVASHALFSPLKLISSPSREVNLF